MPLTSFGRAPHSVWSPLSLSGLAAWYDASDLASITSSGGAVSQWNDKSGGGRNLTQGTSGNRPTTGATTLNGLNVLGWVSANNTFMDSSSFALTQPFTFFVVAKTTTFGRYLVRSLGGAFEVTLTVSDQFGDLEMHPYAGSDPRANFAVASTSAPFQGVFTYNGASSAYHVNGAAPTSYTGAGADCGAQNFSAGFRLGHYDGTGTYAIDGFIAESVMMSGTPTAGDLAGWNAYCSRWGL